MLRLYLFGAPRLEREGRPVPLRRTKALALLAYLAASRQPHERETLLGLLWPEFDAASARNNLRRELSLLRAALGDEVLHADGTRLACPPHAPLWVDVGAFADGVAAARQSTPGEPLSPELAAALGAAVALAGEDFLAGFGLPDCPAFDEWQFFQRESLRQQLAGALATLIPWHRERGALAEAIALARRWLALDQLYEPAQRELIRLYALAGQHAAALRQYESFRQLLAAELGAEPDEATRALAALVRARRLGPPAADPEPRAAAVTREATSAAAPRASDAPALPALPPLSASFTGRAREAADIVRRLLDPDCRLLTLVGPGGVGKTQLALRVAHTLNEELAGGGPLADGVLFLSLLPIGDATGLVADLAAALQLELVAGAPPARQLAESLRERRMLIVLDSFEQLADGAAPLDALLAAAPGVRFLVTSRVALNLPAEWFHPVDGLSFPDSDTADVARLAHYDAVRLFEQLARRARGDFQLGKALGPTVRLCRMVAGMPLALELAAGWLKTLTVEQVVAAIARDLDALSSRDRSLPERHRAMRTVFAETWQRLSADERAALAALSVFVGEFTPDAAQAAGGASLHVLAGLVEHALLRATADGHFLLHDLLRQFAAEQLPAVAGAARERHAAYYLALAAGGAPTPAAPAALRTMPGNLRAAWLWALAERRYDLVEQALAGVAAMLKAHGNYLEGEALFAQAAGGAAEEGDEAARVVAGRALIQQALFRYRMGYKAASLPLAERGQRLLGEQGHETDRFFGALLAGLVQGWQGEAAAARRQIEAALGIAEQIGARDLAVQARLSLSWLCSSFGEYDEGRRLAEAGLADARAIGDHGRAGFALRMVACAASASGAYAVAERHLRESLELAEATGYRPGVAASLNGLGWALWCGGGSLDEAGALHERSLELMRAQGDLLGVTMALSDLAVVALDQGDQTRARALGEEGLAIADRIDNPVYRAQHLAVLGQVAAQGGAYGAARSWLSEALRCALDFGLWPQVAAALYAAALLLLREAEDAPSNEGRLEARAEAARLFAAVAGQPASWHVYRARAELRLAELRRLLPATLVEAETARGRALAWGADLRPLAEGLAARGLELGAPQGRRVSA